MTTRVLILEQEHPRDLEFYQAELVREFPDVVVEIAADAREAIAKGSDANVLVAKAHSVPAELVKAMGRLRWIQALTTGTDHLEQMNLPAAVVLTSARGIHGPQMSELALLLMMALSRDLPRMLENQSRAAWERWPQRLICGKTAVLVGVGAISEELAVRCQAFGMNVIGVSAARTEARGFDRIRPREELAAVAATADFLVVLVPYSAATHHLIDARVLRALPPRAILINIARGKVIDELALVEALRNKQIAGAGLDVFSVEPLPTDSPLWAMKNVIVTPRIGGMSDAYARQAAPLLIENLRHFRTGDVVSMRNIVQRPDRK